MTRTEARLLTVVLTWLVAAAAAATYGAGTSLVAGCILFALLMLPWGFALLIGGGAPPPTVAELLHAVEAVDDVSR